MADKSSSSSFPRWGKAGMGAGGTPKLPGAAPGPHPNPPPRGEGVNGADALLRLESLNQYYGGSHILRNVGFEARLGEVTVILGRNGVGKTTLLKSLMGVVPVKTGKVMLDGKEITRATSYERVRAGIGYVPQGRKKVTVLHEGSVLAEGLLSDVQANEQVVEVYLGR